MDATDLILRVRPDTTTRLLTGADHPHPGMEMSARTPIVVDDPDSPIPALDPPAWAGTAGGAGVALVPGEYRARLDDFADPMPGDLMAAARLPWNEGLRAGGSIGVHVDAEGARHVAWRELHADGNGRPAYWRAVCSCTWKSDFHYGYGEPFVDIAWNAARDWTRHLPA
ncbi:hypothetical protein [Isoptericola sp. NPDC056605]|uniref:hypothetical protein n=1 Tax=Isoptericola sp. NPDC056605 TaxID=3345876 RepID=UPI0036C1715A